METLSLSRNLEETKKLKQKLIALEKDFKNFQESEKSSQSRRFSTQGFNSITRLLENSPRTLMSSLQNVESEEKETTPFKARSLLQDFENAVEYCKAFDDGKIHELEDRGSVKQGKFDHGSCSSSCLSDECYEEWMEERGERGQCRRRGLVSNGFFVIVLMGTILGLLYMICSFEVYGDEEEMLLPT